MPQAGRSARCTHRRARGRRPPESAHQKGHRADAPPGAPVPTGPSIRRSAPERRRPGRLPARPAARRPTCGPRPCPASRAWPMTSSSAASGSAPGWANTATWSRTIISVGIDWISKAAASSGCASVSTLREDQVGVALGGLLVDRRELTARAAPRRPRSRSGRTRSSVTIWSKFSLVSSTVLMCAFLFLVLGAVGTVRATDSSLPVFRGSCGRYSAAGVRLWRHVRFSTTRPDCAP